MAGGRVPVNHVDEYLSKFYKKSDFCRFDSPVASADEDSMWEFRLAIHPVRENLNNAVNALLPYLIEQKLTFKFLALNHPNENEVNKIAWDGRLAQHGSDRDQRGKEMCVYIRRLAATGEYEKSPAEIKEIMLNMVKRLKAANVEFGYMPAPVGDKEIPVDGQRHVNLFSYTANKPWKTAHGILLPSEYKEEAYGLLKQKPEEVARYAYVLRTPQAVKVPSNPQDLPAHNPCLFEDPFAGIELSLEELEQHGMNQAALTAVKSLRSNYLQASKDVSSVMVNQLVRLHERGSLRRRLESVATNRHLLTRNLNLFENQLSILEVKRAIFRAGQAKDTATSAETKQKELMKATEAFNNEEKALFDKCKKTYLQALVDICDDWPCTETQNLEKSRVANELVGAIENIAHVRDDISVINKLFAAVDNLREAQDEITDAKDNLQTFYQLAGHHAAFAPYKDMLYTAFEYSPAGCQRILRQFIHAHHQEVAMQKESLRHCFLEMQQRIDAASKPPLDLAAIPLIGPQDLPADYKTPEYQQFIACLRQLHATLHTRLLEVLEETDKKAPLCDKPLDHPEANQLLVLTAETGRFIDAVMLPGVDPAMKLRAIEDFERRVRVLPCMQKSTFKTIAKAIGCVIVAAVGAVLGVVIGAAVEGAVMYGVSAPAGGLFGLFGAVHGAVMGGINGWSAGLVTAAAIGLATGIKADRQFFSFRDQMDEVTGAAEKVARLTSR